jgi:competence protein ComEA
MCVSRATFVVKMENVEMPEVSRRRALAYAVVLLVLLFVAGRFVVRNADPSGADARRPVRGAPLVAEDAPVPRVVVHVVGAVRRPGLYRLAEGSRVDDAIRRAGGAKAKAALEFVNLAAPVADGQQVVVPARGAEATALPGAGASAAGGAVAGAGGRVHLNTATLEQLDALPGIGPVTAQKILDYRERKGAFSSVDELDAVPGIGPTRLAELKELVDL